MAHAKLSPSKAPRWRRCPASVAAEAVYPEERSSPATIDGTHSHTLLSTCVGFGFMLAEMFVGQTLKDDDGEFVVDKARAERVQFALDFILSRGGQVISERRVDPAPLLGIADLDGTADITIMLDDAIEVWDYKDGMGVINADSEQLEQYGFGVIAGIPTSERSRYKTITLGIIQPKLREKGMEGTVGIVKTMDQFMAGAQKLIDDANATRSPDAPFVPGDHCKYCAHSGCAARTQQAMASAGISFADLSVAQQAADKDASTMTDAQLRELIEGAPLIRQTLEMAEKEALRRFNAGQSIDGLKVVRGNGSRAWAFNDDEMAEKLKRFGLPKEVIWQTKLISPAQAEKSQWKKRDGTEKSLSDKQLKLMASEYIKKSDGALKVVSVSDPKPAVIIDVSQMFAVPDFLQVKE